MKKFRNKITSILLLITLIMSVLVVPTYANEKKGIDEEKLAFMQALDLLWGYEKIIEDEALVQKADLAILLARCMNIDLDNYTGEVKYHDVNEKHRAFAAVNILSDLGVFIGNGDGTFGADSYVDYSDVITLIARIAGYTFPDGRVSASSPLLRRNLLDGITFHQDTRLTSYQLIEMLYNFLNMPIVKQITYGDSEEYVIEENNSYLSEFFNIYLANGKVVATDFNSLVGYNAANEGRVRIDEVEYNVGNTDFQGLLGCEVEVYYKKTKDDHFGTILHINAIDCEIVKFKSEDATYSNRVYTYYDENNKKKTETISIDARIVYNGVNRQYSEEIMTPSLAEISLYNSDNDNEFETIYITSYETYVVQTNNTAENIITFKFNKKPLDLEDEKINWLKIVDEEGNDIPVKKIKTGNVLMVEKSENGERIKITVCKSSVSGKIESISEENGYKYFKINDEIYKQSIHYPTDVKEKLKLGDTGKFVLDKYGSIVAKVGDSNTGYFAYVINKAVEPNAFGTIGKIKVFSEEDEGTIQILELSSKNVIDGYSCDEGGMLKGGSENKFDSNVSIGDIISITKDIAGKIKTIETKNPNNNGEAGLNKTHLASDSLHFRDNTLSGDICMDGNTIVFGVPEDKDYIKGYNYSGPNLFIDNQYYKVDAYAYDERSVVADVVVTIASSPNEIISEKSQIRVVGDIYSKLNEDEEIVKCVDLYGASKVTYTISENCTNADKIESGDTILIGYNSLNEIVDIDIVYDKSADKCIDTDDNDGEDSTGSINNDYWAIQWKTLVMNPYQIESGFMRCTFSPKASLDIDTIPSDAKSYPIGDAKILVVEEGRKGQVTVTSGSQNSILDFVHYGNDMTKVVAQAQWSRIKTIIVYK